MSGAAAGGPFLATRAFSYLGTGVHAMASTVDRRPRPLVVDRRTATRIGVVAGTVLAALGVVFLFGREYGFFDLKIYHGAVMWWADGRDLYTYRAPEHGLSFTYPPFAALAMLPMALLPTMAAGWVNTLASLTVTAMCCWWLVGPAADRFGWPREFAVALSVPIVVTLEPFRETIGFGQVNILLLGLVLVDLVALRRGARWAGVGTGLAAAIKLTPALFILYFVLTKQWRAALTSTAAAVVATLVTWLVANGASMQYWTSMLWDTERVGAEDATPNQALTGVLARLYEQDGPPALVWLTFALLVLTVGMNRAMTAHSEGDELAAFVFVGLTTHAISPISWSHHLVWIGPALLIVGEIALQRRSLWYGLLTVGGYVLFAVSPIWIYEHKGVPHWSEGFVGVLGENSLALAILALIAIMPWRPGVDPVAGLEPAYALRRAAPVRSQVTVVGSRYVKGLAARILTRRNTALPRSTSTVR